MSNEVIRVVSLGILNGLLSGLIRTRQHANFTTIKRAKMLIAYAHDSFALPFHGHFITHTSINSGGYVTTSFNIIKLT